MVSKSDNPASDTLPIVSVIIATFNSAPVLPRTLKALVNQDYPRNRIEILAIDGGSSDDTRTIAADYGCIVLDNPETNPGSAKLIGVRYAHGKYLLGLDHDEVLINADSIRRRVELLETYPECKVADLSGYRRPDGYPLLNQYLSDFGDPFSLYIYGFSSYYGFYEKAMCRVGKIVREEDDYFVVSFENARRLPIFELINFGRMISLEYFRGTIGIDKDIITLSWGFYLMLRQGQFKTIVIKNAPIDHYSIDSLRAYLPKLKWRIRNNIHFSQLADTAYTGRVEYTGESPLKKYFFIPYALIFPIPIAHSIYLALTRKNPIYLIHTILCWYIVIEIFIEYSKKLLKRPQALTSYDGKKKIT